MELIEKEKIHILHLSDLHFGLENGDEKGKGKDIRYHKDIIESFFKLLESTEGQNVKPDFIVISGDITQGAKNEEYKDASKFVNKLLEHFNLSKTKVLFVPGNHDKKRSNIFQFIELLDTISEFKDIYQNKAKNNSLNEFDKIELIDSEIPNFQEESDNIANEVVRIKSAIDEFFSNIGSIPFLKDTSVKNIDPKYIRNKYINYRENLFGIKKSEKDDLETTENIDNYGKAYFREYESFANQYYSEEKERFIDVGLDGTTLKSNLVRVVFYAEFDVVFVLLNSAWLCENSKRDPGKLALGNKIILSIEDVIKGYTGKKVITVMHHCPSSFNWYVVHDKGGHRNNLATISEFSTIILSGHEHGTHLEEPDFIDNNAQLLSTGTFYPGEKNRNCSCSYYTIDFEKNSLLVENLIFNDKTGMDGKVYWIIKKELDYPLANPKELMKKNGELKEEVIKLKHDIDRYKWLYESSKE